MTYPLEALLRPPVEFVSAANCAFCGAVVLAAPSMFLMTPHVSVSVAGLMWTWGAYRAIQGVRLVKYHRNLQRLPKYEILADQIPVSRSRLFLGRGFRWNQKHTQRLYDTRKPEYQKYTEPSPLYQWVRTKEWKLESKPWAQSLIKATTKQRWGWLPNPVAPLPSVHGTPAIHGVEVDESDVTMDLLERNGHTLVLGTTRVGKTRLAEVLITQDIGRGDTVIVFDPKGDAALLLRMYAEAKRAGRESEFYFFHLGYPEISARYNPVGSFSRITEVATRIAGQLPGEGQSAAFKEFVWRFVNVMARTLVALGSKPSYQVIYDSAVHVDSIAKKYFEMWLNRDHPSWIDDQKGLGDDDQKEVNNQAKKTGRDVGALRMLSLAQKKGWHDPIADGLASILSNDRSYFEKLVSSLYPLLEKLTTGKVSSLLSPDYDDPSDPRPLFDWAQVINKGGIVYVGLDSLSDYEVAGAVGNAMFADLTSIAGQLYKFGQGYGQSAGGKTRRICIHADEFNELIGDEFIPLLNKGGGAGYQVTVYTQTWSDVEARIGSAAKAGQISGNLNTLVMLRVKNVETAEILTNQLGEINLISATQASSATDTNDPRDFAEFGSKNEDRLTSERAPTLTPNDLMTLPKGQAFALIEGGQLWKLRLPLIDSTDDIMIPKDLAQCAAQMKSQYASMAPSDEPLVAQELAA